MRLVFNGKEKLRLLSNYGEYPIACYAWQLFDSNVEVVTDSGQRSEAENRTYLGKTGNAG
jgi:hypothetical protein